MRVWLHSQVEAQQESNDEVEPAVAHETGVTLMKSAFWSNWGRCF